MDAITFIDLATAIVILAIAFIDLVIAIAISATAFVIFVFAIVISAITFIDFVFTIAVSTIKDMPKQVSVCVRISSNRRKRSLLTLQQSSLVALTPH